MDWNYFLGVPGFHHFLSNLLCSGSECRSSLHPHFHWPGKEKHSNMIILKNISRKLDGDQILNKSHRLVRGSEFHESYQPWHCTVRTNKIQLKGILERKPVLICKYWLFFSPLIKEIKAHPKQKCCVPLLCVGHPSENPMHALSHHSINLLVKVKKRWIPRRGKATKLHSKYIF